jgi:hypothetical protein
MNRNKLMEELKFDEGFIDEIYEDHLDTHSLHQTLILLLIY